jgi:hypothetical protein
MNQSEYVESVESFMNETKSKFKFALLQKVHHIGYKLNGIISRRLYAEDPDSNCILYDIALAGRETRVIADVSGAFLVEGHLKEE